ncbi:DNA-directed RNA polymerase III subunit C31 [Friedmanniomyces endolithicus]|uniref:DNA-directed RNA polymerase III subunit C31 n=1 Tax=Friedmanniomyces endolithicus TaxID=329885 RepID=A0AAN6HAR5_9PEZI|nr:DNA-directed RNA polymerase III subunit C31 [Friedmanniomyces endolithicus]KAK0780168.1 DNA-directed RNA polymerase III subunit C31 [Friedmanniomyces endolithicus]KAK0791845.1 DNA-directed RNA polymerase III subunit C31 [Friedmanniomyces endolithicus]KAK0797622.1 DNA-directed RNA polymerase III subunit C31 [Friedmanniomyces endolithicus]KAK0835364.1 DNA-directed RNA polymerase III subunit C31 [Friedmanniomyces endolithicus]
MSRGGRGGFGPRSGPGMMTGVRLPFDVDPELEITMYKSNNPGEDNRSTDEDPRQRLFPPYPGSVPHAPPPTAAERKLVSIYREIIAEKHAGPAFTGPPGSLKALCGKRTAAEFNPFEDQQTYGKKYERRPFRLADPKKRKWQAPHFFPRELWAHIGYDPVAGEDEQQPRKRIVLNKKSNLDKLARFDDDAEGGAGAEEAEEEVVVADEDGEEDVEPPRDDDFSEDEDDDANDYNAEQYFDDGEDDHDEGGGDDGGGEEW